MADQDPWEQAAKEFNAGRAAPASGTTPTASVPATSDDWKVWQHGQADAKPKVPPGANAADYHTNPDTGKTEYRSPMREVPVVGKPLGWLDENFVEPGLTRATAGAQQMMAPPTPEKSRGRNIVGGASEVARGLGQAMAPPLVASGMGTPAKLALGLGVGAAGQWGTETGLNAVGVPPEYSAGASDLVGFGMGTLAAHAVDPLTKLNPEVATTKAWRPGANDSSFPDIAPSAVSDVKTFGNPNARTNADTYTGAQAAIENHSKALEAWMQRARQGGVTVSGNDIVAATQRAIPETMWLEDPEGAQAIVAQAKRAYGGKRFSVDNFRQYLKEKNAGSAGFHNKSEAGQKAGALAGTPPAIEEAQAKGIRETLYNALDPENQGAGPREIQERTGELIKLRNASDRRSNQITAEKPVTPLAGMGKVASGAARLFGAPFHGDVEGAWGQLTHPINGPSDALIGRIYDHAPEAMPLPMPKGPYPNAAKAQIAGPNQPNRYSFTPGVDTSQPQTGGTMYTPPPPDTSSVRGVPAMAQPPNPRRAIAPGRGTIITPPPPDTSGGQTTTGPPLRFPTSRQIPAGGAPPISDVKGGPAGDITDLVPSINPDTGSVEYIPRPAKQPLQVPSAARRLADAILDQQEQQ